MADLQIRFLDSRIIHKTFPVSSPVIRPTRAGTSIGDGQTCLAFVDQQNANPFCDVLECFAKLEHSKVTIQRWLVKP